MKVLTEAGLNKFLRCWLLAMAGVFLIIGVLGICDGICSVLKGGYADNIVLGSIIATTFPLVCISGYLFFKGGKT